MGFRPTVLKPPKQRGKAVMSSVILFSRWFVDRALTFLDVVLRFWWVCLIIYLLGVGLGIYKGIDMRSKRANHDIAQMQLRHYAATANALKTMLAREAAARQQYQAQTRRVNDLAALVLEQQKTIDQQAEAAKRRVSRVTTVYKTSPAAEPTAIPHCVFTRGWLREYNAALGYSAVPGDPAATTSGQPETEATQAGAADSELLESGISPADILMHTIEFGGYCSALEAQFDAVVAAHE